MPPLIPAPPVEAAQAGVGSDGGRRRSSTHGGIGECATAFTSPRRFAPVLPFSGSTESRSLLGNPLLASQTRPVPSSFPPKGNYLKSSLRLQDVQLLPGNNALFLAHQRKKWQIDKNYLPSSKATALLKPTLFFRLENELLPLRGGWGGITSSRSHRCRPLAPPAPCPGWWARLGWGPCSASGSPAQPSRTDGLQQPLVSPGPPRPGATAPPSRAACSPPAGTAPWSHPSHRSDPAGIHAEISGPLQPRGGKRARLAFLVATKAQRQVATRPWRRGQRVALGTQSGAQGKGDARLGAQSDRHPHDAARVSGIAPRV